jgi:cytosine/adenosine deaminase-related metal-dependent hydrolase
MITRRPAEALGLGERVGTLSVGKAADAVLLPIQGAATIPEADLFWRIVREAPTPVGVFVDGVNCG